MRPFAEVEAARAELDAERAHRHALLVEIRQDVARAGRALHVLNDDRVAIQAEYEATGKAGVADGELWECACRRFTPAACAVCNNPACGIWRCDCRTLNGAKRRVCRKCNKKQG